MAYDEHCNARRMRGWRQAGLAATLLVAGCATTTAGVERLYDSHLTPDTPIDWWHNLEGGLVAEQRPPPPGVGDPYPNLASVPARPVPTDQPTRRTFAARLASERNTTLLQNAQDPLVMPSAAAHAPRAPGIAANRAGPAPDPDVSTATFDAAAAPAVPSAAPPRVEAPDTRPAGQETAAIASGPIPAIPGEPPPVPALPGLPAAVFAPATLRPRLMVEIGFARGADTLPPQTEAALQALAGRRFGGPIQVSAGGDATGNAPEPAALDLALRRVQAIRARLTAAGVPANQIHQDAHADGRGGRATLID